MPLRALALAVLQAVVLKCRGGVALPLAFVVAVQGLPTGLTTSFSLKIYHETHVLAQFHFIVPCSTVVV